MARLYGLAVEVAQLHVDFAVLQPRQERLRAFVQRQQFLAFGLREGTEHVVEFHAEETGHEVLGGSAREKVQMRFRQIDRDAVVLLAGVVDVFQAVALALGLQAVRVIRVRQGIRRHERDVLRLRVVGTMPPGPVLADVGHAAHPRRQDAQEMLFERVEVDHGAGPPEFRLERMKMLNKLVAADQPRRGGLPDPARHQRLFDEHGSRGLAVDASVVAAAARMDRERPGEDAFAGEHEISVVLPLKQAL